MRSKWVILLVLITSVVATTTATLNNQKQSGSPKSEKKKFDKAEFESQFPVVDYNAPKPTDPEKLAKREAKGNKYNKAEIPVDEQADTVFSVTHWETDLPALPVAQSQVIVIGRVSDARAFLSTDKTSIYSEFTISVDEVLKDNSSAPLVSESEVVAERSGGRVRFPSGHVTLQQTAGQGMPRVGRRYVFFLERRGSEPNISIITGYELRGGRVELLDNPAGGTHPIAKYKGVDEASFLETLRNAIANPANHENL